MYSLFMFIAFMALEVPGLCLYYQIRDCKREYKEMRDEMEALEKKVLELKRDHLEE